ncbi:hypothetical protein EF903_20790 [Streptomyces sp. WAC05292]|nr:hypothetical protein EF903_20790 [Streptomyces sp. WAC05292]
MSGDDKDLDVSKQALGQIAKGITEPFQRCHRTGDEAGARNARGSRAVERGVRRLNSSVQEPRWFPILPHSTCLTPWSSG